MSTPEHRGPLSHLKVLDLSRMYPGAFCTLLLSDLGADVLKVEGPGAGDGMRFMTADPFKAAHVALNRGKRSITLDLRNPKAPEVLRRLVAHVDVVVESHRPGALDKLGIGYEQLREVNPRLIWCSLTGFGPDGPHAHAPGHDITYLGYSGLLSLLGGGRGKPPIPDIVVAVPLGGVLGAVGILAAVVGRERTGTGTRVDASLVDGAMWLISEDIARAATSPGPGWGTFAAREIYRCADGLMVTVAASEAKPWALLCEALRLPDLVAHVHGVDEEATTARLAEAFAAQPAAHWVVTPGLAGGVGPINGPADLVDDPHVVARQGLVNIEGTTTPVLASPLRFDGASAAESSHGLRPAPGLGEQTEAALAAAGFSAEEIAALRADGVV